MTAIPKLIEIHAVADDAASDPPAPRKAIPVPHEKQCRHLTASGAQCRAPRRHASEFCIFHDNDFRAERQVLRRKRQELLRRMKTDTAEGLQAVLDDVLREVRRGRLSPQVANSIGYLAQVMIANHPRLAGERLTGAQGEQAATQIVWDIVDQYLEGLSEEMRLAGSRASPLSVVHPTAAENNEEE
jgi:hypothetical protein